MADFFKKHWTVILIGLFGVALGVFANTYLRKMENKNLLISLVNELKTLQSKTTRTPEEDRKVQYLEGEIYILKFKCS